MCIIIAEAGENHLGDMDIARRMIDLSKTAGADYVKFQYYNADKCADSDPEKEWFKKVELDTKKLKLLYDYAGKVGIRFLCTPWDIYNARGLFALGLKDIKIASFHITDYKMLEFINQKAEKVFMSTGMSTQEEIDRAVKIMNKADLYLLHCVSEYPLAEERVNLRVMDYLKERYGCKVGYSDHTLGILAPLAAVAIGADVIEKHITLSKGYFGTDHILSADPAELKELVRCARRIETMLGSREKVLTEAEAKNRQFLRNRFSYYRNQAREGKAL